MSNPFAPPACTCALLRRVTRAVTRDYEAALKLSGINPGQFTLLSVLAGSDGLPVAELAKRLDLDRTTLTRNLAPLQRESLVAEAAIADHRVRKILITPKGLRVQAEAEEGWRKAQTRYVDEMGADRWAQLTRLLEDAREIAG